MTSAEGQHEQPEAAEDVKRRFREALDRKHEKKSGGTGGDEAEGRKKVPGGHGPAHTQRQFRRKSG